MPPEWAQIPCQTRAAFKGADPESAGNQRFAAKKGKGTNAAAVARLHCESRNWISGTKMRPRFPAASALGNHQTGPELEL